MMAGALRCCNWFPLRRLGVALCVTWLTSAQAQGPQGVSGPADCSSCRLSLSRIATLGDSAGPGMVSQQGQVVRDSRGHYYVTSNADIGRALVFAPNGRFVASLGRSGTGPGEFQDRPLIRPIPGGVAAFDLVARRVSTFDLQRRLLATTQLEVPIDGAVVLGDQRFVIAAEVRSRSLIGFPLHVVDQSGKLIRSFGADSQRVERTRGFDGFRIITSGSASTFWAARINEYLIEEWDTSGTRRAQIKRQAEWFPKWTFAPGALGQVAQPPNVFDLRLAGDTLWVFIRVTDQKWHPPVTSVGTGERVIPDTRRDSLFDTIVELIDVRRHRLILSHRFTQNLVGRVGDDLVATYEEDRSGNPRYVIWRISVTRFRREGQ